MKEATRSPKFMKNRRNFSELDKNFLRMRNHHEEYGNHHDFRPKANSIKINRSKLPPDFFPRSESVRKKIANNKNQFSDKNNPFADLNRKAQTERNHHSPQKTSFFGFFEENQKKEKNHAYTLNLKRKFQSREEPKRQKLVLEQRNFTPLNGTQRIDFFESLQNNESPSLKQAIKQVIKQGKKNKGGQISPRKQHMLKYQQAKQNLMLDPEKDQIGNEDMHNITFFNAKSTSFPPINKNKSSS